jgi:hypothetical protein
MNVNTQRYIVFLFKTDTQTEVHFNNFNKVDFYSKTNEENTPLKVLSSIFNIVHWYCLADLENVVLEHESQDRLRLYQKISEVLIQKHKLPYEIILKDSVLTLIHKQKNLTERFLNK